MNKKLFKVVATLLSLSTLLLPLSACGNSEFVELTQRTVSDLNYVGVREDLTIVSNVYEEVDLTTLGLKDNAYFLFRYLRTEQPQVDAVYALKTEFTEAIHRLESQTTEAINNNTLVMQKLLDKLEEK